MSLRLTPLSLGEANRLVADWHRHNRPVPGCKFCIGCADDDGVQGAAGAPASTPSEYMAGTGVKAVACTCLIYVHGVTEMLPPIEPTDSTPAPRGRADTTSEG